jgi:hypothetical protein
MNIPALINPLPIIRSGSFIRMPNSARYLSENDGYNCEKSSGPNMKGSWSENYVRRDDSEGLRRINARSESSVTWMVWFASKQTTNKLPSTGEPPFSCFFKAVLSGDTMTTMRGQARLRWYELSSNAFATASS